jgi:hypothetical protein
LTQDRLRIGQYVDRVRDAITEAISREESILIAVHPVWHAE